VKELLKKWQVLSLPSPAYTPQYNGSCEAGNGAIKTRAHYISSKNGRPGKWTCDDVEEARFLTNQTARPWGPQGPTPEESWNNRQPIPESERKDFDNAVIIAFNKAVEERSLQRKKSGDSKAGRNNVCLMRNVLCQTMVSAGYLKIRRR
ncbi:MAG: hypothetical protein ACYTFY_19255, partial [Planctomycetota bacterium]